MDKDFHYYVTYAAALTAGWDREKAVKIAESAQYVDDCVPGLVKGSYRRNDKDYGIISTFCGNIDTIFMSDLGSDAMWMSFHFLPGNFKAKEDENREKRNYLEYNGEKESHLWKFDPDTFKMQCIPKSYLAEKMINDCLGNETQDYYLDMIGIRAHVLADTVAHAFYSGQGQWSSNEINSDIYDVKNGVDEKIEYGVLHEWCAPEDSNRKSICYMGHARAGHIPDYAYCNYKYIPQWNSKKQDSVVFIKHKETYEFAFKILVQALYSIRTKQEFQFGIEYIDYLYNEKEVLPLISKRLMEHIGFYHEQIQYENNVARRCKGFDVVFKALGMEDLKPYSTGTFKDKRFESFNYAALKHFMLVREVIQKNGFHVFDALGDITDEAEVSLIMSKEYKNARNFSEQEMQESNGLESSQEDRKGVLDVEWVDVDKSIDRFFTFNW